MTAKTDALTQCMQDLACAARPALERCLEHVIAELQLLETKSMVVADRDALANNSRYLASHKSAWAERYAADLLLEFGRGMSIKPVAAFVTPIGFGRAGLDSAGLVDDAELNQTLDAQRLLQDLLPNVEQTLAELDALVSSALGLGHVAPERNPLRPEVFTGVLHGLLTATLEDAASTSLCLKHLSWPLGRELEKLYADVIKALKLANISSVGYQYRVQLSAPKASKQSTPESRLAAGVQPGNTWQGREAQNTNQAVRYADLSDSDVKTALLKDFLADGRGTNHALAAPYYDNIDKELADLKAAPVSVSAPLSATAQARLARIPAVDRPQRGVDVSTSLSEQVWGPYGTSRARSLVRTQLKKQATNVSQALGLDVVRQLVGQVAQDPRLLAPVREAIVALEPSLLRLALVDPRFFSDERHVGRQLMERTAQRSFKYNDEFSPEFAEFFHGVTDSFTRLNASVVNDTQPFGTALAALEQAWATQDQQDLDRRQQVLLALRFAQDRQSAADQIAFDLSARSDLEKVPGKVLDFLFGPWALAMAHARLLDTRNQIDPEGYGSVVPDLVWSVKHDVTLKQPAKLIDMIPGLLDKLHSGLGLLGQDPKENDAFFESLMKLHRPVLKLRRLKSQRDAEESSAAHLEPQEAPVSPAERLEKLRANADAPLWMGRSDLDAAGFEDTQPTAPAKLSPVELLAGPTDEGTHAVTDEANLNHEAAVEPLVQAPSFDHNSADSKAQASLILQNLKTGGWVDLYSKRQWLRAQLVWASSHATLFMFISHGGRPHSMTKRSCEKLIAQRLLRPVDTQGVVAQALDAVTLTAGVQSGAAQAPKQRIAISAELETA